MRRQHHSRAGAPRPTRRSTRSAFRHARAKSVWSTINTRRAEELKRLGLMQPPGLAAFEKRDPTRSGIYSFESGQPSLSPSLALVRKFKANTTAWAFFEAQPPGYRRVAIFWVMSAKQNETKERRLAQLIRASENGVRFGVIAGGRRDTPTRRRNLGR